MAKHVITDFKSFVKPDIKTTGLKIVSTSFKGRGIFADKSFKEGELLFEESPLVSCQFAWNEDYGYLACNYCLRSLETAEENVHRLCQDSSITLPCPEMSATLPELHCRCECGIRYCCSECQNLAFLEYHTSLCAPPGSDKAKQLMNLRDIWKNMQYPPETATIMLVLKIFALVHQSDDKEVAVSQFRDFIIESTDQSENICQKLVGAQYKGNFKLLIDAMAQCVQVLELDIPSEWQTPNALLLILSLIAKNNQGIGTSAFSQWVSNIESCSTLSSDERTAIDVLISDLYEKMEEVVGLEFLNNEGSGLYALQSKINHSCSPNVEIAFLNGNHTLAVRALQDIASGDEICSSYIDDCNLSRSRHSRQSILKESYYFQCLCSKCEEQAADPDETSDEEDVEDMSS